MKSTRYANLVSITLDGDDLMELVKKVTDRVMDSDSVLIKMHEWQTTPSYANYLEVLKELKLETYDINLTVKMATQFSDELVTGLFADESIAGVYQLPTPQKEKSLKLARICVDCQKGYIADEKGHTCNA
jgi:hypothetical protein